MCVNKKKEEKGGEEEKKENNWMHNKCYVSIRRRS